MVAAISATKNPKKTPTPRATTTQNQHNSKRPPLLPSEPDNALAPRRSKSREVTSRYMSSSSSSSSSASLTSKRCASPLISRPTAMMTPTPSATPSTMKRSQSVGRRRAVTPRPNSLDMRIGNGNANGGEVSNAQKMLITSTRSLSVSFQGESFSFQVSTAKPASSPISARKVTPERRKASTPTPATGGRAADQTENSRPMEQQLWPARLRQPNSMTRSVDLADDRKRITGSRVNVNVVRALQSSMMDNKSSIESRLSCDSNGSVAQCDLPVASDTESVTSGRNSEGSGNAGGGGQAGHGPRGIVVPARIWQETNSGVRRQPQPGSPGSKTTGLKGPGPAHPKLIVPKKFGIDSPVSTPKGVANSRGQLSPIRGGARPASPSKLGTPSAMLTPMRGLSPSRDRNAVGGVGSCNLNNLSNRPSILSLAADIRRGKIGENRIVEVHLLRILYNRLLQWRFVTARADSALSAQRLNAEKSLYNACATTSKLRESVRAKRTELQWLRHNMKLIAILKGQMVYLEDLALMEQDYSRSLSGAIEALRASTLRLPVVAGARADVQNVNDAICSAVDVLQAMASSIHLLSVKVGDVNTLVAELTNVTAQERALLDQCKDLLSTVAAMQVTECSLRTHIVQVNRLPSSLTTKM